MSKISAFLLSVSFLLGWTVTGLIPQTTAKPEEQQGPSPCIALDVVFVVDQSYSMEWNDPLRNRFHVVKVAMEWLVTDRWGRCPNIVHRVGVISFGDRVFENLQLTPLQPSSEDEWIQTREALTQSLKPQFLGGTDHLAGLREAKRMLEQASPLQGPYLRKKVIILITDGSPCVARLGCQYRKGMSEEAEKQYMEDLVAWVQQNLYFHPTLWEREKALTLLFDRTGTPKPQEINTLLAQYPVSKEEEEKSIYLWVLALHNEEQDYLKTTGSYFQEIAETHGGSLVRLRYNRQDIPQAVDRILSRMLGVFPQRLQCGALIVPPYLEVLSIHIYKNAGQLKVRIRNGPYVLEGGKPTDAPEEAWRAFAYTVRYRESGPQNEHYTFILPRPGRWEISSGYCQGIQVTVWPIQAQTLLSPPSSPLTFPLFRTQGPLRYDEHHPHQIRFRLQPNSELVRSSLQGEEVPLLENIPECRLSPNEVRDCALSMEAEIIDPSGYRETYPVQFEPATSTWVIAKPVPVDQVGTYQVELFGYTACWWASESTAVHLASTLCDEDQYKVIPKGSLQITYQVVPTTLFALKVVTPAQGEQLTAHLPLFQSPFPKPAPLPIRVTLVSVEEGTPLEVTQVFPDVTRAVKAQVRIGEQTREIWLQPSPDGYGFEGVIQNWKATGRDARLIVSLEKEPDYQRYQAQQREVVVEFQRRDTLWTSPLILYGLGSVVGLMVFMGLGYSVWLRTHPITGYLVFETDTREERIPIGGKRRVTVTKRRELDQLRLKKIVAIRKGGKLRVRLIPKQGTSLEVLVGPNTPVSKGGYRIRWEGTSGQSPWGSPLKRRGSKRVRR